MYPVFTGTAKTTRLAGDFTAGVWIVEDEYMLVFICAPDIENTELADGRPVLTVNVSLN